MCKVKKEVRSSCSFSGIHLREEMGLERARSQFSEETDPPKANHEREAHSVVEDTVVEVKNYGILKGKFRTSTTAAMHSAPCGLNSRPKLFCVRKVERENL